MTGRLVFLTVEVNDMDLYESVLEHFGHAFGTHRASREYPRTAEDAPSLFVYQWHRHDYDIEAFCSVGYSNVQVPQVGWKHRLEFYLPARQLAFNDAAELILSCASSPLSDGLQLASGHSVALTYPVSATCSMKRLFLTEPWEDETFHTIPLPGGIHASVLMALPIFEPELAFIRKEGEEAFWEAVEAEGASLIEYSRSPLSAVRGYAIQPEPEAPQ